jgi:hypothetical protein
MRGAKTHSLPSDRLIYPLLALALLLNTSAADARHHYRRPHYQVQYLPVWPPVCLTLFCEQFTGMPAHDDPPVGPIVARPYTAGPAWPDWPRQPDSIK